MVTGEVTSGALTPVPKQKQSDEFKLASAALMTRANCLAEVFCLALMRLSRWVMHRKCSIEQSGMLFFSFFCGVRSAADSDDQFSIHQDKLDDGRRPEHMVWAHGFTYSQLKQRHQASVTLHVKSKPWEISLDRLLQNVFFFGHRQDKSLRDVCFLLRLKHANVCRPATLRRLLKRTKWRRI